MTSINIDELQILYGLPIPMSDGTCFIQHLTMGELSGIGLEKFYQYLNLFTIDDEEINIKIDDNFINLYETLIINCERDQSIRNKIEIGLKIFTGENHCYFDEERRLLFIDVVEDRKLTAENFNEFREILQKIYRIKSILEKDHEMSEAERRMKAKFEMRRRQLAEAKAREGKSGGPTLSNILIGLMVVGKRSANDTWSLPFYTFYEAFYCLEREEQYDINLKSILAGADSKKVKLNHWLIDEEKN